MKVTAKDKYGIYNIFSHLSDMTYLFSGGGRDPEIHAHIDAQKLCQDEEGNQLPYSVVFYVTEEWLICSQVIVFKDWWHKSIFDKDYENLKV